jgi:2-polyprenyl-3-methyl-5-hydroxy-6-metoxy-1,4-benzoquinol methylase
MNVYQMLRKFVVTAKSSFGRRLIRTSAVKNTRWRMFFFKTSPTDRHCQNRSNTWMGVPSFIKDQEWIDFLVGERIIPGLLAPDMPDPSLQRSFVGSSGREALSEASEFCLRLVETASDVGKPLNASSRVLDFGCGWGRLYRVMLRWCNPKNLVGVDIDGKCIDICRKAMPYGRFVKSEIEHPLAFEAASFEIVYAYSVFSHLAQNASYRTLLELARVLKPDGLAVFTTLKRAHLGVWQTLLNGESPYYRSHLRRAGFDYDKWQERADRGDFLYVPTGGGDMRDDSFYGEAVITRRHLEIVAKGLGFKLRLFDDESQMPQSLVVLQRE